MAGTFSAQTMAGTTISISASLPATADSAGFSALSYTLIAKVLDFDNIPSRVYTEVEFSPLDTRETERAKGTFLQETITANLADVQSDAGQDICKVALNSDVNFSFQIVFQNGDISYFCGLVSAFTKTGGDGNTIVGRTLTVLPSGDTVEIVVSGIETASLTTGGTYTVVLAGTGLVATQNSSDGAGTGAVFDVTMVGGAITVLELITNSGTGYIAGEIITVDVEGATTGTGATFTVDSINTGV